MTSILSSNLLKNYIPETAVDYVNGLMDDRNLVVKIKNERKTRHGDYRKFPNGQHQITINSNLNPYKFLITLVHEISHLVAYETYGTGILPHGKEWKYTFKQLMLPLINPEVFPDDLLKNVARHFIKPKASSDTDQNLSFALNRYNPPSDHVSVSDLKIGSKFRLYNGRVFTRGEVQRKRILCTELRTKKKYLFNPMAQVELIG